MHIIKPLAGGSLCLWHPHSLHPPDPPPPPPGIPSLMHVFPPSLPATVCIPPLPTPPPHPTPRAALATASIPPFSPPLPVCPSPPTPPPPPCLHPLSPPAPRAWVPSSPAPCSSSTHVSGFTHRQLPYTKFPLYFHKVLSSIHGTCSNSLCDCTLTVLPLSFSLMIYKATVFLIKMTKLHIVTPVS